MPAPSFEEDLTQETLVRGWAEDTAARRELYETIAAAVEALAEPLRGTVVLRYLEGLTSEEIARRTGVPEGTVRARLATGLDEIRRKLDHGHEGRRERWLRVLVPLLPPASRRQRRPARRTTARARVTAAVAVIPSGSTAGS
jgi:hypothetical protein